MKWLTFTHLSAIFLYNNLMNTAVIAINYVSFQDVKKRNRQHVAMEVLSNSPKWIYPIALGLDDSVCEVERYGIRSFNLLRRNSRTGIGNDRDLPYIKEIMDITAKIDCDKIGYINSDILVGNEFYEALSEDFEAYIFSRSDIAETCSKSFLKHDFKVIYGGDKHIGADGFFFKKEWWLNNRNSFPDNLIIGETEWDTCYRKIIKNIASNYLEKRVLYHVYHDAKWGLTSPGARNNIKIWRDIEKVN
ncbi:MAG: hypothetical protein WC119_06085 [Synergistaceae bacterium]